MEDLGRRAVLTRNQSDNNFDCKEATTWEEGSSYCQKMRLRRALHLIQRPMVLMVRLAKPQGGKNIGLQKEKPGLSVKGTKSVASSLKEVPSKTDVGKTQQRKRSHQRQSMMREKPAGKKEEAKSRQGERRSSKQNAVTGQKQSQANTKPEQDIKATENGAPSHAKEEETESSESGNRR